ncbi:MAG TPA: Gfo/Idh/MocA family oxidoreductase, partial [Actinomycetes bacterium]|nr:Gfo/Idh/MocA family oxidoreductase [Actinomycetes bacterium]
MIGVGLIGYGLGGAAFHAPLVQAEPRLRLHAVATSRAEQVRRDLPGVAVVASPAELLEDPAVELVVVAAPNAVHAELAAAALRAGRHVVVDKPFTLSVAEADELIGLAAAAGRRLSVFHNRRWDSDFLTVRRCLETGLLGDVSSFVSRYDRFRPVPKGSWKEQDVPGSGVLWDLGPHLIDQALLLFGRPETVWADVGVQRPGVEAVDYVHLLAVHGDRGSFVTWGLDRQEVDATLTTEVAGLELRGRLAGVPAAHHAYYAAMAAAVDGQGPVPVTPAEARDTIAVIEL